MSNFSHSLKPLFCYELKKSKFISYVFSVNKVLDFEKALDLIKKDHCDAKQICYAYSLNDNGIKTRVFNDKEPKGIANSLLFLFQMRKLQDVAIIVVRYFGGTKLGKSNLYRAYLNSAKEAIKIFELNDH